MSVATVSLSSVFGSKLPSIYETTFAKTDKTDAILVVDGKKLHVNKTLLSCHSDYFNALFNSDSKEKSQEEIEIKDVKFEDFATLLSLVHPNPIKVGAENAEKILALADRFRFPLAKNHLENVLMLSTISDKVDKMRIGDDDKKQNQMANPTTRCVFWPRCTKREACQFVHPTTACNNFPNCAFGQRCLFIHPNCRFDRFCVNKHCPFTHPGTGGSRNPLTSKRFPENTQPSSQKPSARGARGNPAEKLLAVSIKKKNKKPEGAATSDKKKKGKNGVKEFPNVAPLQNPTPCRYAGGCRNPVCPFKHPKECRFGANCRNPSCHFYHKPSATPADAKYKWTAASTASTAN